jgi:hypothetical protein
MGVMRSLSHRSCGVYWGPSVGAQLVSVLEAGLEEAGVADTPQV